MKCIACGHEHEAKFCPMCGERNAVDRISLSSILESSLASLINMDKGFLFNFKTLLIHPQELVLQYIKGKRKGILNPISFLIYTTTLYLIVISLLKLPKETVEAIQIPEAPLSKRAYEVGFFIREYIKFFWILSIIPLALSLKLIFRTYNYAEYLAMSSFIIAQSTFLGILSYLVFRIPLIFDPIVFALIYFLILRVFRNKSHLLEQLFSSLAALILFIIQWAILMICLGLIIS